jgi:PepSY-associated transmembrane protein
VRSLFLTHRYLGFAVSLLMVMWCLSGAIMMYVPYPRLAASVRLSALAPLDLSACCVAPAAVSADASIEAARVEMVAGRAVALLQIRGRREVIDLKSGQPIAFSRQQAASVAREFAARAQLPSNFSATEIVDDDQWTVAGDFKVDRPLYKFSWSDAQRTGLYVSSTSGQAVQLTHAKQRLLNWLGSVPHWVYFTALRRHADWWNWTVIVASLLGCFLTAIGIFIGISQLRQRPPKRWTPYRGFMAWHHIPGLIFGAFALTWVFSGLLSLNPWGLLEGDGAAAESERIRGAPVSWQQLQTTLHRLSLSAALKDVVSLRNANFDGRLFFVAAHADGQSTRLDANGLAAPLTQEELKLEAQRIAGDASSMPQALSTADSYYFPHHDESVPLPVYRLLLDDPARSRYYLDPVSGEIVLKIDQAARGYRWLYQGLHRWDWSAALRRRPTWDILTWLLLSGASLVCATGLYGAVRRIRLDLKGIK